VGAAVFDYLKGLIIIITACFASSHWRFLNETEITNLLKVILSRGAWLCSQLASASVSTYDGHRHLPWP
jgi:hypothetical protein